MCSKERLTRKRRRRSEDRRNLHMHSGDIFCADRHLKINTCMQLYTAAAATYYCTITGHKVASYRKRERTHNAATAADDNGTFGWWLRWWWKMRQSEEVSLMNLPPSSSPPPLPSPQKKDWNRRLLMLCWLLAEYTDTHNRQTDSPESLDELS